MRKSLFLAAGLALATPAAMIVAVEPAVAGCGKSKRTGTIVGAVAGGALGAIVTHGAAGPILGAVAGGLGGRAIARHKKC